MSTLGVIQKLEAAKEKVELLHAAIRKGQLDKIRALVIEGGVSVAAFDKNGNTALHTAAKLDSVELVKFLITECKADVQSENRHSKTVLHIAAYAGRLAVVRFLVEVCKVDLYVATKQGWSALHFAAAGNHPEVVKYLQNNAKKSINLRGALHIAAEQGSLKVAKYFIEECKLDVNVRNSAGLTALHHAVRKQQDVIVSYLVEKGADIDAVDNQHRTLIHMAAEEGHLAMVSELHAKFYHGATSHGRVILGGIDKNGRNALYYAAAKGHTEVREYLQKKCKVAAESIDFYEKTSEDVMITYPTLDFH